MKTNNMLRRLRRQREARKEQPMSTEISSAGVELAKTSKRGIEETADLVEFIAVGVSTAITAGSDGYSIGDLGAALSLLDEAKDALQGIKEVPAEMADLTGEEIEELVRLVAAKLIVPPSKASDLIPYALRMAGPLFAMIAILKADEEEEPGS